MGDVTPFNTSPEKHLMEDVLFTPDNFSEKSASPGAVLTLDSNQGGFTVTDEIAEYIEDERSAVQRRMKLQSRYQVHGREKVSTVSATAATKNIWHQRTRDFLGVSLLDPENERPAAGPASAVGPKGVSQSPETAAKRFDMAGDDIEDEAQQVLRRQQRFYEEKYYLNLIKTNIWLSIVSKAVELVICAVTGFKDGFATWLSNAIQLVFNVLSSLFILWRFRGRFSTSKADHVEARVRERLAIFGQCFCKLASAATILVYACVALAGIIDVLPAQYDAAFIQSSMLTAGVTTGGSAIRAVLCIWISLLLRKQLPSSSGRSVSSENKHTWINAVLSLKTAVVSYLLRTEGNADKIAEIVKYSNIVDVLIGVVSVHYGVIDLLFGYNDRKQERNERAAATQKGGDVLDSVPSTDDEYMEKTI